MKTLVEKLNESFINEEDSNIRFFVKYDKTYFELDKTVFEIKKGKTWYEIFLFDNGTNIVDVSVNDNRIVWNKEALKLIYYSKYIKMIKSNLDKIIDQFKEFKK